MYPKAIFFQNLFMGRRSLLEIPYFYNGSLLGFLIRIYIWGHYRGDSWGFVCRVRYDILDSSWRLIYGLCEWPSPSEYVANISECISGKLKNGEDFRIAKNWHIYIYIRARVQMSLHDPVSYWCRVGQGKLSFLFSVTIGAIHDHQRFCFPEVGQQPIRFHPASCGNAPGVFEEVTCRRL